MFQVELIEYQPGTGTRYLLICGIVTDPMDAMRLGCGVGDMFVSYHGRGSYTFNDGVVPNYLAEKFRIEHFMLDVIALTQFVRVKMGKPLLENYEGTKWKVCDKCKQPVYLKNKDSECYCGKSFF